MRIILVVLSLLLNVGVATAQKPKCAPTTTPPRDNAVRLQLTTSIAEVSHSVEDGLLNLTLNLNYLNTGTRPILLDKKSSRIYRQLVSKDLRALSACKYIHDIASHFTGSGLLQAREPERSEFVTLAPGESVTFKREISLFVYDGTKETKDDLRPGNYVLQVRVAAWFYAADPAEWEQKWGNQAYLWSENITSEPMSFTVEKPLRPGGLKSNPKPPPN